MTKDFMLIPVLTESSYAMGKDKNVYVFKVPINSNKHSIARAIEAQFSVSVTTVNTTKSSGKSKRVVSIMGKRYTNNFGKQSDYKKAYISLKKGDKLPILEGIEEAEKKQEATQEKFDKAVANQSEKEAKKSAKPTSTPLRRFLRTKKPESS